MMNSKKRAKLKKLKSILLGEEYKEISLKDFYDYDALIEFVRKISKGNKGVKGDKPVAGKDYKIPKDGTDAIAPVKGKDYFTLKEISEFLKKITPVKGKDYKDGESIKGDAGYTPIKGIDYDDGLEGKTPIKGDDYDDGYTPIKGKDYFTKEEVLEFLKKVTPVKGKDYADGKTIQGKRGKQGRPGLKGKGVDEDKLLLEILERLEGKIDEDLTEQEKRVLEELTKKLGEMVQRMQSRGGGIGRQDVLDIISGNQPHTVRDDLSSQCDSSNMIFNLSKVGIAGTYVLQGTQFPIIYRPGVDYNVAPDLKTVTLVAAEVGAPKLGQTLVMHYEERVD